VGRIRILVADGHRIFAEALATALAAEPDVDVAAVGTAQGAERALDRAQAENRSFQVLLVDADLPAGPAEPASVLQALPSRRSPVGLPIQRQLSPPNPPAARIPAPRTSGHAHPPPVTAPLGPLAPLAPLATPPGASSSPAPAQHAPAQLPSVGPRTEPRPVPEPGDGITLAARVRVAHPALQVVVIAAADDPRRVVRALHAGVGGWVAKESSLGRLMAVVRGVLRDETHIPPLLLTGVIRELTAARRDRSESEQLVESLTPREKEVLRCMVAGLGRQAVADRLYLSPHTVRTHMQNVLGKLHVHSTLAAVAVARRAGVGPAD
jgi:DNA-binding NarL/FixJ family response regulator